MPQGGSDELVGKGSNEGFILVVEDDARTLRLERFVLEEEGFTVVPAGSGEEALDILAEGKPTLVMLDIGLPGMDGFTTCEKIRESSQVPIIMVTAEDRDEDKVRGLESGADDYVTKPFNPRELVARVKAVLRRASQEAPSQPVLEADGLRLDTASREVTVEGQAVSLRAKEFDLLTAFLRHPGIVLDRERLLQLVWGTDYYGDTRTIDVHVAWLREKLARAKRVKIQTVWGVGYKLVVETDATKS